MATTSPTTKPMTSPSLEASVYSQEGKKAQNITLPSAIFGLTWNADLVHEVVTAMMANARAGIAHTKDRGEISGGGKKPWRQKGTGRARHGSSRSPIWVGGGTTFGPRNEKDYTKKVNKKTRTKALFTVLSRKYRLGNILFIDTLVLSAQKTKEAATLLGHWSGIEHFEGVALPKKTSVLLVLPATDHTIAKSFANLPGVTVVTTLDLNAMIVMKFRHIVVVDPAKNIDLLTGKLK